MHAAGDRADGLQLRGLILVLRRAGLRISKALAVNESDLDPWPRRDPDPPRQGAANDAKWGWTDWPAAARAGIRRRFAPHQLRHAHAVEMSREGVPLLVIQRQLRHADLTITSVYLRGIDNTEIVHAVHERPAPMIPATHGLYGIRPGGSPRARPAWPLKPKGSRSSSRKVGRSDRARP